MFDVIPEVSYAILILFNFFIFWLSDLHYPVYLITGPFLCIIWSDVDSLRCTFSFQLLCSSVLIGSIFFIILSLCWSFTVYPEPNEHFYDYYFELYLVDSIPPFHLVLVLGLGVFCLFVCLEHTFFSLCFACLFPCIRQVSYDSSLEKVALFAGCPMGPRGRITPCHQLQVLQRYCSLGRLVWPPIVTVPQLLCTHQWARLVPSQMAVRPSLNCCRHTAVCWCQLRMPTGCGRAGATLELCQPG